MRAKRKVSRFESRLIREPERIEWLEVAIERHTAPIMRIINVFSSPLLPRDRRWRLRKCAREVELCSWSCRIALARSWKSTQLEHDSRVACLTNAEIVFFSHFIFFCYFLRCWYRYATHKMLIEAKLVGVDRARAIFFSLLLISYLSVWQSRLRGPTVNSLSQHCELFNLDLLQKKSIIIFEYERERNVYVSMTARHSLRSTFLH